MPKLIRITTIPVSMQVLLKGQMKFMKAHGFDVTMMSSDGPEIQALQDQEGCPHIVVPLTRTISPWKDFICLIRLVRLFKEIKPDIVHTHTPKAGLLGMWAARFAGVPVRLHTIAGLPWMESSGALKHLLRFVERLTAMPASYIYPNSVSLKLFLENQKVARGKMKVLGKGSSNGINTGFFSKTAEIVKQAADLRIGRNVSEGSVVWIFVGRLVKDKGIGELLDAFLEIHRSFPGDQLWLVGKEEPELDPLDDPHQKMLHTHPGICCWGFQSDIRPYLAAAQVLAFPSYREGFPNVPMQAGLMGCMLLLSDINGCNEIVQHKLNGLLVPAKDQQSLASAMFFTRENPELRKAYADAIRVKITNDYDQEKTWNLILEEYKYWLAGKRP